MDTVAKSLGLRRGQYRGVFEGDDSLTAWPSHVTLDAIQRQLGLIGVAADMERYSELGKAGYCSMYWNQNKELICDPIKVLATFPYSNSQLASNYDNYRGLLGAKAMSLAFRAPGCPIVSAVARRYISYEGIMETRNEYERRWYNQFTHVERTSRHRKGMKVQFSRWDLLKEPSVEQRLLFWEVFGIDVPDQREAERRILTEDGFSITLWKIMESAQRKCGVNIEQLQHIYQEMRSRALLFSKR